MKGFLAVLISISLFQGFAQDSTKVRFHVKGGQVYYVRIDGKLMPVTNIMKVSKGSHEVEIWSPKYNLYKGKLETGNLDSTNFVAILEYHKDWPKYIAQRENYKNQVFWQRTAPFFVGVTSTVGVPITLNWMFNSHEELVKSRFYSNYQRVNRGDPESIYRISNRLFFTTLIVAAVTDVSFLALKKRTDKLQPPVFKQENPFTNEIVEIRE